LEELRPEDPRQLGAYRLISRLGGGGMGRVFLGRSPGGRLVAVKVIHTELADGPDFRARFAREVEAARRVGGMFTAPVVDASMDGQVPWLATAYVRGPSLGEAVFEGGPLPAESVLALAAGLAEGLGAIHAAGVVHRDLKPSNVLLSEDGPRVIDFGISRAVGANALTRADLVVGSPGFMSPEQAEGQDVGTASDVFSLGAVLVFAATGGGPFGTGSITALLYRVVHSQPNLSHLSPPVRSLAERCLAKDPQERPTTGQILAELEALGPDSTSLADLKEALLVRGVDLSAGPSDPLLTADKGPGPGRTEASDGSAAVDVQADGHAADSGSGAGEARLAGSVAAGNGSSGLGSAGWDQSGAGSAGSDQAESGQTARPEAEAEEAAPPGAESGQAAQPEAGAGEPQSGESSPPDAGSGESGSGGSGSGEADPDASLPVQTGGPPTVTALTRAGWRREPAPESTREPDSASTTVPATKATATAAGARRRRLTIAAIAAGAVVVVIAALVIWAPWVKPPVLRPTGVTADAQTISSVSFRWANPATGPLPDHYTIVRDGASVGSVPGTVTFYRAARLAPDTPYRFQVLAVRDGQSSARSTVLTMQTLTPPVADARLTGESSTHFHVVSTSAKEAPDYTTGRRWDNTWTFTPNCPSGPCDVTLSGDIHAASITAHLTRNGAVYTGTTSGNNLETCGTSSRYRVHDRLKITIKVNAANVSNAVWTAGTWAGKIVIHYGRTQAGPSSFCAADVVHVAIKGTVP
jgi:serine/threonine protein kinase